MTAPGFRQEAAQAKDSITTWKAILKHSSPYKTGQVPPIRQCCTAMKKTDIGGIYCMCVGSGCPSEGMRISHIYKGYKGVRLYGKRLICGHPQKGRLL